MKKLILVIVSIIAIAGTAYGTALAMKMAEPPSPLATSVNTDTMPDTNEPTVTAQVAPDSSSDTDKTASDAAIDTQIKHNLNQIAASLSNYAANNRGAYPTSGSETITFENNYLNNLDVDPITKKKYSISAAAGDDFAKVDYRVGYTCAADGTLVAGTSSRQFGLVTALTSGKMFCVND